MKKLERNWEVIVIGTGIGGATIGYALAKAGKGVLFIEKGINYYANPGAKRGNYAEMFFPRVAVPGEAHRPILEQAGRWADFLEDASNGRTRRHIPFIGAGTGGSSTLYGAAMERFFPEDFTPPGECYAGQKSAALPEVWPIRYTDLAPYYAEAESLYGVRGGRDPLRDEDDSYTLSSAPEFGPANQVLADFLAGRGLHPYRLPTACEFAPGCQTCQGFICPRDCKNDSVRACLRPAIEDYGAKLLDRCEVQRLEADTNRVTSVVCDHEGNVLRFHGESVILAAGALATPVILLRSTSPIWPNGVANTSGLVGRNLMRHCIDLYAISQEIKPAPDENTKELAFNDFYVAGGEKLGSVQSFGRLPPASMLAESIRHDIHERWGSIPSGMFDLVKPAAHAMMRILFGNALVLAATLEDLPYHENCVLVADNGGVRIRYRLHTETKQRIARFRQLMAETLKPLRFTLIKQAENNDRIAHACGTCRFGTDPEQSVLNPSNRTHDLENLLVVDSSFFPTSAGTNPSLTIAANALRVAAKLVHRQREH